MGRALVVVAVLLATFWFARLARRTLEETVANLEWRSDQEDSRVYLAEFAGKTVDFEINVWVDDVATAGQRRSDLNEAIWGNLKKAGIEVT